MFPDSGPATIRAWADFLWRDLYSHALGGMVFLCSKNAGGFHEIQALNELFRFESGSGSDRAETVSGDRCNTFAKGEPEVWVEPDQPEQLPACRPLLPTAAQLLPYLQRMDRSRRYSNHGLLVFELERRLAERFGVTAPSVVTASSGTAALVGAILATAGRATAKRPLAICPSYTFVATAHALEQCGYVPYLVDVEEESWQIDPLGLSNHPMLSQAGVVVPVAVYGRPISQRPWIQFSEGTGVPVVIDGATSFERLGEHPDYVGPVPVALSFHATKAFSTGEGGAVIVDASSLAQRCLRALNFGFLDSRESQSAAINGKMNEYQAAIGLAQLDHWSERQTEFARVAAGYREAFGPWTGLGTFVGAPQIASNYAIWKLAHPDQVRPLQVLLGEQGMESRLWYGLGLHRQPYFASRPQDSLTVTERLAPALLGLPMAPDLSEAAIGRVVSAASSGMSRLLARL